MVFTINHLGSLYDERYQLSRIRSGSADYVYMRDEISRLTAIVYPDSSQNVTFVYDVGTYGKGHLTSLTDASGQTAYAYNAAGQMISETRTMYGHSFVTQYGYDPATGDMSSITYPGGMVLTYQRDSNGQISGIYADGQPVVSSVSYMPFGPVKDRTLGNGFMTVSETYDDQYRTARIQAGTISDYQYGYDAAGNVTSVSGLTAHEYTFNPAAEPTSLTASGGYTVYKSPMGAIPAVPAGTTQSSHTGNRISGSTGQVTASYTYDGNGNILSDGSRNFVYNQKNQLVQVNTNGIILGEYAYDAFSRRVRKTVSGVTTLYHYDLSGKLIAETDGNGTPQRNYIYLNGEPVAVRLYAAFHYVPSPNKPFEIENSLSQPGMFFFLNDHLGTPQKIVNASGNLVWQAVYQPFGEAQIRMAIVSCNLRFPGQYFDSESGLHYNWHRYYDPETGRYITADPIGLEGGVNLYSYVENSPVNLVDPSGLLGWFVPPDRGFDPGPNIQDPTPDQRQQKPGGPKPIPFLPYHLQNRSKNCPPYYIVSKWMIKGWHLAEIEGLIPFIRETELPVSKCEVKITCFYSGYIGVSANWSTHSGSGGQFDRSIVIIKKKDCCQ